jgi:uridylate kinase
MKKQNNEIRRLVLKKHIIRVLNTKQLVVVAGGSGNDSVSISTCPQCTTL